MSRRGTKAAYGTFPIRPREFLDHEKLIRELGVSRISADTAISRVTLYEWFKAGSLDADPGARRRRRQEELLAYLGRIDSSRTRDVAQLLLAQPFREGPYRNRLSRWMQLFYDIRPPGDCTGRATTSAAAVSNRALDDNGSRRFIEGELLWLPIGSEAVSLLMRPDWCPERLTALGTVDNAKRRAYVRDRPAPVGDLWPGLVEMLSEVKGKGGTYNGFTYDVLSITTSGGLPRFEFCGGHFFNQIACGEALLWELAISASKIEKRNLRDGDRAWVHDMFARGSQTYLRRRMATRPFDLAKRSVGVGINTLTVFAYRSEPAMFLMHERGKGFHDPGTSDQATEAHGMLHVIPAGGWQPYDDDNAYHDEEFRFGMNVLREFCEEVLAKEALMRSHYISSPDIVYSREIDLQVGAAKQLFDSGGVTQWYLGCGLDLVTLKLEMMTLLIVNGDRFRAEVASRIPRVNREGKTHQYPFRRDEIQRALSEPSLLPAGAGCLWFAVEQFDAIVSEANRLVSMRPCGIGPA